MQARLSLLAALLSVAAPLCAELIQANNSELKRLQTDGIPLIDVRVPAEWRDTGVIEGSHLMMFFDEQGEYDIDSWLSQLSQVVGKDQPFALICASGGRTKVISQFLEENTGYPKIHNVTRGIQEWIREGNPTVPPPE